MLRQKTNVYDHVKIEKKWQKEWEKNGVYKTSSTTKKPKKYVLDMFPYPSGQGLHVGHPRGYIASDVYARLMRMKGFNVLHPMGYDAFGLPAEQYAIQHKIHPRKAVEANVKTFESQLHHIGFSYDWSRKINTTDPKFYKWTQWIFLKMFGAWYNKAKNKAEPIEVLVKTFEKSGSAKVDAVCDGDIQIFSAKEWKAMSEVEQQKILMKYRLAYEGFSEVNWCPELGTVLANDEIVDGPDGKPVSERGGYPVVKKSLRQWFLRITAYAERLIDDLADLDWSPHIKEIQKNWIGRSEGVNLKCVIKEIDMKIEMFDSIPQTFYAQTFAVIAPDHALLKDIIKGLPDEKKILQFADNILSKKNTQGFDNVGDMEGIFTGRYIHYPAANREIPLWVASYAVSDYGTGIVSCSAHDERDFAFAKKFNIPLKTVLFPENNEELKEKIKNNEVFYRDPKGVLEYPEKFKGRKWYEVRQDVIDYLVSNGWAERKINFKMRDAIFARQRYWGEPIPLVHEKDGAIKPLKDKDLPLTLPNVKSYEPIGTGESPLAGVKEWVKNGYETNTMPGWAGSSWYFLRYMDPHNASKFAGEASLKYWKQVDVYVGGAEHATGHLLYSRLWHKFLFDIGLVPVSEPFKSLRNQGMILGSDNRKMSKRWGNVINPDDVVKTYGADTLRVFEMFIGPFDSQLPWSTDGIIGSRRFVERVWRLQGKISDDKKAEYPYEQTLHKTIKKVGEDIESFNFNTAISSMMICTNEMESSPAILRKHLEWFLQILAPFAPHVCEEIWMTLGNINSINVSGWPNYDPKKLVSDTVTIVVQVNGKVRGDMKIIRDADEKTVLEEARKNPTVAKWIGEGVIIKVILVPNRLINIVVKG